MQEEDNLSEIKIDDQKIIENAELSIWEALIPVFILMGLLAYNIFKADGVLFGDYSNQYILLMGGGVAAMVDFRDMGKHKKYICSSSYFTTCWRLGRYLVN